MRRHPKILVSTLTLPRFRYPCRCATLSAALSPPSVISTAQLAVYLRRWFLSLSPSPAGTSFPTAHSAARSKKMSASQTNTIRVWRTISQCKALAGASITIILFFYNTITDAAPLHIIDQTSTLILLSEQKLHLHNHGIMPILDLLRLKFY